MTKSQKKLISQAMHRDFSGMLEKIRIPVLAIGCSKDEIFRVDVSREMAQKIPGGKFKLVKSSHSGILKNSGKFSHIIETFVKSY